MKKARNLALAIEMNHMITFCGKLAWKVKADPDVKNWQSYFGQELEYAIWSFHK